MRGGRRRISAAGGLILALALSGCGVGDGGSPRARGIFVGGQGLGEDGSFVTGSGESCVGSGDCFFGETCVAGFCAVGAPPDERTFCTADSECEPLERCAFSTGRCVPVAEEPDPASGFPRGVACDEGDTRTCGYKVGLCRYGAERCAGGQWDGDCRDGVAPVPELCNLYDDDCDGLIDEEPSVICLDDNFCNGSEVCVAGTCEPGSPPECSEYDTGCTTGFCDSTAGACVARNKPNGTTCDDGRFCTDGDKCILGLCQGGPLDCSGAADDCNSAECDEAADACVPVPLPDDTPCDDRSYCTLADRCSAGICGGDPRDCSSVGDACNYGRCDEAQDACLTTPRAETTPCDDGDFCTVDTTCAAGQCVGGQARDCTSQDDGCNVGICDSALARCIRDPKQDGTLCADALYCTVNEVCREGFCVKASRDCNLACPASGSCDEDANLCRCADACAAGGPVAAAGPDASAVEGDPVQLDASGSSDPNGQNLTYLWTVQKRPLGSTATFSSATGVAPTIVPDRPGIYDFCVAVTDTDNCTSEVDCLILTVSPRIALTVELTWTTVATDLDLHLLAPGGAFFDSCTAGAGTDAYAGCVNPDWGPTGADGMANNDPLLDPTNDVGLGPERIQIKELFDGDAFIVGTHYYGTGGGGGTSATITVTPHGQTPVQITQTGLACGELWQAAKIVVSGGGTAVTVTPLATPVTYFEGIYNGCAWQCTPSYRSDSTCDCGCGAPDPTCLPSGCSEIGCCAQTMPAGCDFCSGP